MDESKNRPNDHLGVNKIGKNIRKIPLHQQEQPQPHVYNISKNDFRSFVQQLTGSGSGGSLPTNHPQLNPPKPQNSRLQKVRPAPLSQLNTPLPPPVPNHPSSVMQGQFGHFGQPSPKMVQPVILGNPFLGNAAESPISAYMRYLQASPTPDPRHSSSQSQPQNQTSGQNPVEVQGQGQQSLPGLLPSPRSSGFAPPTETNASPFLLSPSSQFLLSSPRSPYPLWSPMFQNLPLTPNFAFSPSFPFSQTPPSPGLYSPLSSSGFFSILSPRSRNQ